MTTVNSTLSPALERALDLLIEPPTEPDASKGYLDLLGSSAAEDEGPARNTGPIQAVWASSIGSMLYDNAQALSRRFLSSLQHPIEWLNVPQGGIALDVGAGRARCARRPAHRWSFCGPMPNACRYATRPSMPSSRSPFCS